MEEEKEKEKEKEKKVKKDRVNEFAIIHPNAAGIDISSKDYVVAVPPDRDEQPIRTFGCFTCDLVLIALWLIKCKIDTVAIESTGIYWKQLMVVLQEHGIEVYLVNSRHVKNVTGKKTDESDASWIQRLHTCGLLSNSFQPTEELRTLRAFVRHRQSMCNYKSVYVNKMEKSLQEMNIKLNVVLSDIKTVTGQNIIAAIIKGERDPEELFKLVHYKVKATKEDILKSLEGNWREECIFELSQAFELYNIMQEKTVECDKKIEEQLEKIAAKTNGGDITGLKKNAKKKHTRKNELNFAVCEYLTFILGINTCMIYGISDLTALSLFAETGIDLSAFKTGDHFTSWIGLAPNNKISGHKIISSHLPKKWHPLKILLIQAANSLYRSDNPLGDYYRRMKSRLGPKSAKCALARKLAIIYYNMVTKKVPFNMDLMEKQQAKFKEKRIKHLEKQLADLKHVA
jgi:transposase